MKRLHVATLGLNRNDLVGYVIHKRPVDALVLVYTNENKEDMLKIRADNESSGIPVLPVKVEPWDYHNVLAGILGAVTRKEYEEYGLEFNPSCGTRVMTAAAYMASLMTDSPVYFVTDPQESGYGDLISLSPMSLTKLPSPRKRVLGVIEDRGGTVENRDEIKSETALSKAQVSRHVKNLAAVGYVEVGEGKGGFVRTTNLGKIVYNMKKYRNGRVWGRKNGTHESA